MEKVLVVDDTKNIRLLLTKCLELEGYKVDASADGMDALEKLLQNKYDLIFLDIKMPHYSGTEVLREIREHGIQTPVIIITAYATIKNAVDCTKLGAVAYLQKPFTAEKVKNTLAGLKETFELNKIQNEKIVERIEKGETENINKILKQKIGENPLDPEPYRLLGLYERKSNRFEEAEKYEGIYKSLIERKQNT